MKLFGWELRRQQKLAPPQSGRWYTIADPFTGAWQQDASVELDTVLTFSAVFACIRLISSDIGKMPVRLMRRNGSIWQDDESPAFSPVLKKPNAHQTRIKFVEQWVTSKLIHGNAYILKGRDQRGVVNRLIVLDPTRVQALVSDDGEVFYRLKSDNMVGVSTEITLPASEIIHDVHVTPDHPLVGVSPIGACGLTAMQGMNIQRNSEKFFKNMSRPGGMLTAPGAIGNDTAERLKTEFETRFGGENLGKIAVAGDGLRFESFTMKATDAQLIEQLKWTAEDVCRAFGVPAYKVGVGQMPTHNNMGALNKSYYSDTLQELVECIELLLDEGLELPGYYRTQFDLEKLLRMDTASRYDAYEKAIKAGWKSPNEVRELENQEPVEGGEFPIIQQQNWPLPVLSRRDPPGASVEVEEPPEVVEQRLAAYLHKELADVNYGA